MNDLSQAELRTVPYLVFLKTDYWKDVRAKKIEQAGGKCERCARESGLQVHHASYENRGDELGHMDDLVVLCRQCHADEHGVVMRDDVRSAVVAAHVSDRAKIIGLGMADHWSAKNGRVRVRLDTLGEATGKLKRTLIRGINELVKADVFVRARTGRASIYYAGPAIEQKKALRRHVPRTPIGPALGVQDKRTP